MKKIAIIFFLAALAIGTETVYYCRRPVRSTAMAESALQALGGLRSIAGEIIWFRADRLQEEGRYVELAQLAHALTMSEPHTPEVWAYAAWNLAYNVSVMMPTPEDRWRWVDAAITLLRDDALKLNPESAELYRELAWMFEIKLGTDIDSAASVYRRLGASRHGSGENGADRAGVRTFRPGRPVLFGNLLGIVQAGQSYAQGDHQAVVGALPEEPSQWLK